MTNPGKLLTVKQAAFVAGVDKRTLLRWEADGRITAQRTPGGHRRYRRSEIEALLTNSGQAGA